MLKPLKKAPLIDGPPITFTHQEGARFSEGGKFDLPLFKRKLVEKALILVLRYTEEVYTDNPAKHAVLRDYSVIKARRRFWGNNPIGYHIIRLHYGYGQSERKIALRYVRSSEDNFNGNLFNHPPRRIRVEQPKG